jgi:argininosuccinate lyase
MPTKKRAAKTTGSKNLTASVSGPGLASQFTASLHYDRRLFREDIAGSIAHARMLARQKIIAKADSEKIVSGLKQIGEEIEGGNFNWRPELEDIHMNIESRLFEVVGDAAGRLHTARSRNDQVATDTRLWVKGQAASAIARLRRLQRALLSIAETHADSVMPGYTHLQRGQPVTLGHHMLAYFEMFDRDAARFAAARRGADTLPLGSGAMAGVPYPLDRHSVAAELGFADISANSMDAVSDRDYMLDFMHSANVCQLHLSRLADEVITWSSEEFGFVRLSDAYTTGSSIMPQKRNPDFAELVRGKTGRVFGHYLALLTVLKGLPLTYNRDLQEDKEALFDSADTVLASLDAAAGMLSDATFNADRMRAAAEKSYVLATDIADYLVRKGVPFREAYVIVQALSREARAAGKGFGELSLTDYRAASPKFGSDVARITVDASVAARDLPGGTAPGRVREAVQEAYRRLYIARSTD